MTDTARPLGAILALLPDNTAGAIEPQDVRDWAVSLATLKQYVPLYNFAAITGSAVSSGTLTAAALATITFTSANPCPWGVNGSDANHYLYISGGTGTAEAVLITGGTAVAGGTSGTLTFVPANNHTGAWTITSASAGWREQMLAYPLEKSVFGPVTMDLRAKVTTPNTWPGCEGQGFYTTFIDAYFTTTSIVEITSLYSTVRGIQIRPRSGVMTAGAALDYTAVAIVVIEDVRLGLAGGPNICVYRGIRMVGGEITTRNTWMNAEYRGYDIPACSADISDARVVSEREINNGNGKIYIAGGCALYLSNATSIKLRGFWHAAGIFESGIQVDLSTGPVNEVHINDLYLDNWAAAGILLSGTSFDAASWTIGNFRIVDDNGFFTSAIGGYGVLLNGKAKSWQFSTGQILYSYGFGVNLAGSCDDISFSNVSIFANFASVGNGAVTATAGAPSNIRFDAACNLGVATLNGLSVATTYGFFNTRVIDHLTLRGSVGGSTQANKIVLSNTETNISINCEGIGNVRKTVVAAATLTFPVMNDDDVIEITGTTALATAVAGLREGQKGVMKWTDATPGAVSQVATIQSAGFTPTRYKPYPFMFSNGVLNVG